MHLEDLTNSSVPKLKESLRNHLKEVEKDLRGLPEPIKDKQLFLLGLCRDFVDEIKRHTDGRSLVSRTEFERLHQKLWDGHPMFDVSIQTNDSEGGDSEEGDSDSMGSGDPDFEPGYPLEISSNGRRSPLFT
jgi:hypothetical protein